MAKTAADYLKKVGSNPGRSTLNGSVLNTNKELISQFAKATDMSNGEVIDAMTDLFFADTKEEPADESEEPAIQVDLTPSPPGPDPISDIGAETGFTDGLSDSDDELKGAAGPDKPVKEGPYVESGKPLEGSVPSADKGTEPAVKEETGDRANVFAAGGDPESRSPAEVAALNEGYPTNLEIF